ncbi:hypothetical protein [Mucilaginibacter sp. HD30]
MAAEAFFFFLDKKEAKNQVRLIAATSQARLPAAHPDGPLRFFSFSTIYYWKRTRQQDSFGRNQAKDGGHVRKQGHSNFLLKPGRARARAGQKFYSPCFCLICRAGHVRQRSLSADLIFVSFY